LNTYVLFSTKSLAPAAKAAPLKMEDETQHRLGGSFQAAADRYASDLEEVQATQGDDEEASKLFPAYRGFELTCLAEIRHLSPEQTLEFHSLVSVFVAAIRTGVLEVEHAKEPLAHYGRFGITYDAIVKKLVDVLRDEGIYNREADTVQNIAASALQDVSITSRTS
jgi:cohesin complex subunit SA-1/2